MSFEIIEFAVIGKAPVCEKCERDAKWIRNGQMLCNECFWKLRGE